MPFQTPEGSLGWLDASFYSGVVEQDSPPAVVIQASDPAGGVEAAFTSSEPAAVIKQRFGAAIQANLDQKNANLQSVVTLQSQIKALAQQVATLSTSISSDLANLKADVADLTNQIENLAPVPPVSAQA